MNNCMSCARYFTKILWRIKMGRYLDVAFVSSGAFLVLFVILSFTGKDARIIGLLSAISAFCIGVLINAFIKKAKKRQARKKRSMSQKKVKALIYADEKDALNAVYGLLTKKYRLHSERLDAGCLLFNEGAKEIRYALVVLRKYKISPDDLLAVWREIRRKHLADKILFAVPGKSDPDVKLMPIKLTNPDVQILEKSRLIKLARKHDLEISVPQAEKRVRFLYRIKSFINRKRALRYIACALLLTLNYIFFGKMLYLIFASVLAFAAVFSLISQSQYEFLSD